MKVLAKTRGAILVCVSLLAFVASADGIPFPVIVLTFDHYRSTYDVAFPIMKRHGLVGTFYVDPRAIDREVEGVSSEELREMQRAGWEIGAYSGINLNGVLINEGEEAARSKLIEIWVGMVLNWFFPTSLAPSQRAWTTQLRDMASGLFENVRVSGNLQRQQYPIRDLTDIKDGAMASFSATDTPASLSAVLDGIEKFKSFQVVVVHKVGDDADPLFSIDANTFDIFCADIERRRNEGRLRVANFSAAARMWSKQTP